MQTITVQSKEPFKVVIKEGEEILFEAVISDPFIKTKKREQARVSFYCHELILGNQMIPFTKQ